jgi:hypothetical protein
VGGYFRYAGELALSGIAGWDGQAWIDVGSTDDARIVAALVSDATGLYAGGAFTEIGGVPLTYIGRWDGVTWHPLGTGVDNDVSAIYVRQEETGGPPVVYVGGRFTQAGGQPVNRIARWDGATWSNLGLGCNERVASLAVFDDGSGPALYAAGSFTTAGGIVVRKVARWNFQTETWSALGQGLSGGGFGWSLAVFPPQPDPNAALYLSGYFSEVDGQPIRDIARWDGQSWSAADNGLYRIDDDAYVMQLRVLDDGHGPALYATVLTGNGGYLQKWEGVSWARYEPTPGSIWSVEVYDGQLHVGGSHTAFHTKIARFSPGFGCGDFDGEGGRAGGDAGRHPAVGVVERAEHLGNGVSENSRFPRAF